MRKIEQTFYDRASFYGLHDGRFYFCGIFDYNSNGEFLGQADYNGESRGLFRSPFYTIFGFLNSHNNDASGKYMFFDNDYIKIGSFANGKLTKGVKIDFLCNNISMGSFDENSDLNSKGVILDFSNNEYCFTKREKNGDITKSDYYYLNNFEFNVTPVRVPSINMNNNKFVKTSVGRPIYICGLKCSGIYQVNNQFLYDGYGFFKKNDGEMFMGVGGYLENMPLYELFDGVNVNTSNKDYSYSSAYGPDEGTYNMRYNETTSELELYLTNQNKERVGFSMVYNFNNNTFMYNNIDKGIRIDINSNYDISINNNGSIKKTKHSINSDNNENNKNNKNNVKNTPKQKNTDNVVKNDTQVNEKKIEPLVELESLIGLQSVKSTIKRQANYMHYSNNKKDDVNLNMIFTGNSGTGKTEVARLIGKLYKKYRILKTDKLIEITGAELKGQYQGTTAPRVIEFVQKAKDGVLFIDEAYGIYINEQDLYGDEIIITLLTELEKNNGKLCCILAGYNDKIDKLLSRNQGLKSRFPTIIEFPNYNYEELMEIAKLMLKKNGHKMSDEDLKFFVETIYARRFDDGYANAKEIINAISGIEKVHYEYIPKNGPTDVFTRKEIITYFNENKIKYILDKKEKKDGLLNLKSLIGLDRIKEEIIRLTAAAKKNKAKNNTVNLNFIFIGNPGTGKTEVARILPDIFYQNEILPSAKFTEITRKDIFSDSCSVGESIHKIVEKSIGGVLFIDEAYSLCQGEYDKEGNELIAQLLVELNDNKGKLACVLAGYPNEMYGFLNNNPGLERRFSSIIEFPNYSYEELLKISEKMLIDKDLKADKDVNKYIVSLVYSNIPYYRYGNAGDIKNAIEKISTYQAQRTIDDVNNIEIIKEDVDNYLEDNRNKYSHFTQEEAIVPNDSLLNEFRKIMNDLSKGDNKVMFDPDKYADAAVAIGTSEAQGSGFIASEDGFIITCDHVIRSASDNSISNNITVRVRLKLRNEVFDHQDIFFEATPVAVDTENDIAILKIDVENRKLPFVKLAPKGFKGKPLDEVVMLGYPFGRLTFDNLSLTAGKITSYQKHCGRNIINYDLDAKHGNSGSMIVHKNSGYCIGLLCGSNLGSEDSNEEINYSNMSDQIWDLIKK